MAGSGLARYYVVSTAKRAKKKSIKKREKSRKKKFLSQFPREKTRGKKKPKKEEEKEEKAGNSRGGIQKANKMSKLKKKKLLLAKEFSFSPSLARSAPLGLLAN